PYYVNSYGMHTIHGRAPGIASGVKIHNPDLSVWVLTGDGDGLSIGGNHLIHALRRNISMNIVLFNNEIYGLTKGQYSPTSKQGIITKSSPDGSVDRAFVPGSLALGAGATFFARTMDTDPKHIQDVMIEAHEHQGTSLVEVFQNCIIFNDGAHKIYTDRATRDDYSLKLVHGEPMIFGKDRNKGLILNHFHPVVVTIGENGVTEKNILVHDKHDYNLASMLTRLKAPEYPVPVGVFYQERAAVYCQQVCAQIKDLKAKRGEGDMQALLNSGDTWEVE
ncbi:MAG: 2-oxoacid:ferredoxin oxidoreductase subunit beta, partial [Bdellovibrionales bacterium]|nr:2-oxoacid:ferredoxin oxidoreductase subunit beta [Bdellovibrionales bacterium]